MNNFHRFINLPFTIDRPKIFDTLKVPNWSSGGMTFEIAKQHVDKRILEWLDSFNISTSQFFEGTYTAPNNGSIGIHSDTDTLTDMTKLLFIWGPENSFTRWWEPKIDAVSSKMRPDQGGPHAEIFNPNTYVYEFDDEDRALCYEEKDCNLLYEKVLLKPSIINAGRLHSTFNNGSEDRWGLTLTLIKNNKRLQFFEALEIFKDIIHE
jgi:hypothetical protein